MSDRHDLWRLLIVITSRKAMRQIDQLNDRNAIPPQLWMVAVYYERVAGDVSNARKAWPRVLHIQTGDLWTVYYAAFCLRNDDIDSAVKLFPRSETSTMTRIAFELPLQSLHLESREVARSRWIAAGNRGLTHQALLAANVLRIQYDALELAAKWKKSKPAAVQNMIDFIVGNGTAEELIADQLASSNVNSFVEANFRLALKYLGDRNRYKAKEHFHRVVATNYYSTAAYG